ncbi:MAG: hypothetical protein HY735_05395 [Verrucomicrobia bacterium]|nr:hypothetical protein [Verrucomicrobiota bacterium]
MEWLLFGIVVLASSLPFLARGRSVRVWACVTVAAAMALAYGTAKGWEARTSSRSHTQAGLTNGIPPKSEFTGYISSDKCQSCHPDQYASWHQSFHRTMTQIPSARTVAAPFDRTLEIDGEKYILERRGDEFWVEMIDPDWKHDRAKAEQNYAMGVTKTQPKSHPNPPRTKKRISLLTGSHNFQAYWVPSSLYGNVQFAFPFAWLFEDQRWVPRKDTFIRDPHQPSMVQIWNLNCIQCHSTAGQPRQDRRTGLYSTRAGEIGIACESCHGPAEEHVRINLDPLRRYGAHQNRAGDPSIVNPSRLSSKASAQVCGQCHSIKWNLYRDDWLQNGFRYRPGGDLEKMTPLVRPKQFASETRLPEFLKQDRAFQEMIYWPDGVMRVTGREYNALADSACHQRGELSCISCHSMHRSDRDDQLAAGMSGNEACFKCHESYRSRLESHTHHRADSSGSQCYNCHMPHDTYGLLKAVRTHYVANPSLEASLDAGRPNACNLCHLDKSLGWTAQGLTEWYGQSARQFGEDETAVSAALTWLLQGDAAQRALVAWNMGWKPARETSGEFWLVPHLAQLLEDPYSAVRCIAYRSLRQFPGFERVQYDYVGPKDQLSAARKQVLDLWESKRKGKLDRTGPQVLIHANGDLDQQKIAQLLERRNHRPVELIE